MWYAPTVLATLLETHAATLLQRWVSKVRMGQRPEASSALRLEEQLPGLLRALSLALRRGSVLETEVPESSGRPFGADVEALVREYGLLGKVLLDLAEETHTPLLPAEMSVFTDFMSSTVADGVAVHARLRADADRDRELQALRRNEDRLRRLIEVSVAGTWELDVVAQSVVADASIRALHHLPSEGPVDLEAWVLAIHPDDQLDVRAALASALDPQGSRKFQREYRVTNSTTGDGRWLDSRGQAVFDHTGAPLLLLGTTVDISARKGAELEREGLLAALEAQPFLQVIVLEGPEHVVKRVNAEYRQKVAGGRDIVGMPVLSAFPHLVEQKFGALMTRVLKTGKPAIGRNVLTPIDNGMGILKDHYFDFVVHPVRGRLGTVDSLLSISLDVTHFVDAQRVLLRFAEQQKEQAAFERQLIGIVSHDLGNPLAGVKLGVDLLLRQEDLAPNTLRLVLRIKSALKSMGHLVDDLLDFTQARHGRGLSIVRAPMNLHEVIRQVVEEVRMTSPGREIVLEQDGDADGSWDAARLSQVAANLVLNALKYSASDASIRVSTHGAGDRVELKVFNRGQGIAAEMLPHLFQPMQRGPEEPDPLGRSVGLGLYIVKHIVEALGGTVDVTSTAEAGTTFTVVLPRS